MIVHWLFSCLRVLHTGNDYHQYLLAVLCTWKSCGNIKILLSCMQYTHNKECWNICRNLVIALLLSLHLGYIKCCCFLCEWGSLTRSSHCAVREWYYCHKQILPGQKNISNDPFIQPQKVILPISSLDWPNLKNNLQVLLICY